MTQIFNPLCIVVAASLLLACEKPTASVPAKQPVPQTSTRSSVDQTLQAQADAGDLTAQLTLGNQYLDEKNNELGRKYMLMAAEQGSIDGLNNLGYVERGTIGNPANMREALKWHRIAEILNGQQSANVTFDKRELSSTDIAHAENEAKKWLEARPNIARR